MIVEKVMRFFSSVDAVQSRIEVETIKEFNTHTDTLSDINWKKTAQTGQTMSNTFSKDTQFSGNIISVLSHNRHMGYTKKNSDIVDDLIKQIEQNTSVNQHNTITKITTPCLPSFQHFFGQKTIIISDFFWSPKQLNECLQACKENKLRCIVIPLLTDIGVVQHPLEKEYPEYFWGLESLSL